MPESVLVMPLVWAGCELDRREPVQARMRPVGVVVDPPCFDDLPRLLEADEQILVQALVVTAMRDKVSVEWIEAEDTFARVVMERHDGERFESTGDSNIPNVDLDQQELKLTAKFAALVNPILGVERMDQLIASVSQFESLDDIKPLLAC